VLRNEAAQHLRRCHPFFWLLRNPLSALAATAKSLASLSSYQPMLSKMKGLGARRHFVACTKCKCSFQTQTLSRGFRSPQLPLIKTKLSCDDQGCHLNSAAPHGSAAHERQDPAAQAEMPEMVITPAGNFASSLLATYSLPHVD